jgi:hypothetical protein
MRRPLPPDLAELGDRLERAAAAALARRRVRRQQVFNAVASLLIAVPLVLSLGTARLNPSPPPSAPVAAPAGGGAPTTIHDDVLPRDLHRQRLAPNSELLVLPSSLRPALR